MDTKVEIALRGSEFKRVLENYFDTIKKEYHLKKVDIEVLLYLSNCKDHDTPTDIYVNLGLNRGHVSQAIDTLIKKDYIESFPDSHDRRIMHYHVTEQAQIVNHKIKMLKEDFESKLFEGISDEEITEFKRITYKIMQNLKDMS